MFYLTHRLLNGVEEALRGGVAMAFYHGTLQAQEAGSVEALRINLFREA